MGTLDKSAIRGKELSLSIDENAHGRPF